jgi:hypothetical protein
MLAAPPKPSATEAEAAAAVLADVSSICNDEGKGNGSVDWNSPSTSLLMNHTDDWRNEVDDERIRREMVMQM